MKDINDFRRSAYWPGTFLSVGSTVITEIAAQYPFKWLLLDMEHGGFTHDTIVDHLRALGDKPIMAIVRIPTIESGLISKLLDAGADGIMVPHVVSKDQIEICRSYMHYPPVGKRGFSSSVRQYLYGTNVPENASEFNKPLLFAQIEDVEGVLNAEEIAAVNEVDALFVGPADLKLALRYDTSSQLSYEESLKIVAAAAINNQKKAGILLRDKLHFDLVRELGYGCIAIGSDIGMLRSGYLQTIKDLNEFFQNKD